MKLQRLLNLTRKAVEEYQMIQDGDRIAVCISGGKDSMLLAKLMQEIQKHGPVSFELVFLVMNPGYNADNWKIIQNNARILGIPLTVFETEIFDVVAGIDKNPCYLCARMRRGYTPTPKNSAATRLPWATILTMSLRPSSWACSTVPRLKP